MKKPLHTPPPWKIQSTPKEFIIISPSNLERQYVASIQKAESRGWFGEQEKANAALIACAPDMLSALKLALGAISVGCRATRSHIKEVIAKAEGES